MEEYLYVHNTYIPIPRKEHSLNVWNAKMSKVSCRISIFGKIRFYAKCNHYIIKKLEIIYNKIKTITKFHSFK